MIQLVYISTARGVSDAQVTKILEQSRRNNRRGGVTGLLLYNGRRFLQALEGPVEAVEQTYARIRTDGRHRAPVMLSSKTIADRQFGSWDMACEMLVSRAGTGSLVDTVDALVADIADPSLRAQFSSYVRIDA